MPPAPALPRILIVEDSIFIGLALQDMCDSLGWALIGPAVTVADGLRLATTEIIDAALLDVEIGGSQSWDIAAVLQQRAIPFAFTTGHAPAEALPDCFAVTPFLRKPFRMAEIEQLIGSLLTAPASKPPAGVSPPMPPRRNPAAIYPHPQAVLDDPRLSPVQKAAVLADWAQDLGDHGAAGDAGMASASSAGLDRDVQMRDRVMAAQLRLAAASGKAME